MRRELRSLVDPEGIPESIFRQNYRLSKPLFRILMREVSPHLSPDDNVVVPNKINVKFPVLLHRWLCDVK